MSRIAKPSPASTQIDVPALHTALTSIDVPPIAADELEVLARGPLGAVLVFLGEHLKGRRQVGDARRRIKLRVMLAIVCCAK